MTVSPAIPVAAVAPDDPVRVLKNLHRKMCFAPGIGWVIVLGKTKDCEAIRQIERCIK